MGTASAIANEPIAKEQRFVPVATLAVLALIVAATGLQFVYPSVLEALRRNPAALSAGQWWRFDPALHQQ